MTLGIVKQTIVADLPSLSRLVLRFVYEPEKMRMEEIRLMEESIKGWCNKIKLDREKNILTSAIDPNALDDEAEYIIGRINYMLEKDASGGLEKRKQFLRANNIEWRKFHRWPESYKPEDFFKAQEFKREYDKRYPEFK